MSTQNDLRLIQDIIAELDANPAARFSYTQAAFDNDIIGGVDVFDAGAEQNIPSADKTDYNQSVIDKGVRAQGASITRMGFNHFIGRFSFNLNKLVQKFRMFFGVYRASLAHNAAEYDSGANYKTDDVCYTVETVENVKVYTWFQRKSLSPETIGNIPPTVTLHWEEMQSKTSSSALLPFSAPGYRHKFTVADLTGSSYDRETWYPVTTDVQDFEAKVPEAEEGAPQVLVEAFCNGAVSGRNTPHRAELAVLSKFTGFAGSSTDIVINNAFVDQEDGRIRPTADAPIGYSKLVKGRQAVIWLRGGSTYALWNSFGSGFELHNARYDNGLDTPIDVSGIRPFETTPGFFKARVKSVEALEIDDTVILGQIDGAISMPKTLSGGAQLNAVRAPGSYVVSDEAAANTIHQVPVESPGAFELVVRGDKAGLSVTTQQLTLKATGEEFTRVLSGSDIAVDWYLSGSPNGTGSTGGGASVKSVTVEVPGGEPLIVSFTDLGLDPDREYVFGATAGIDYPYLRGINAMRVGNDAVQVSVYYDTAPYTTPQSGSPFKSDGFLKIGAPGLSVGDFHIGEQPNGEPFPVNLLCFEVE
jgi:hypothetical protein